jgi:hypothetical protein
MANIYSAGLSNVGSYQVSGIPFLSGTLDATNGLLIDFPYVSRWVVIHNSGTVGGPGLNISLNVNTNVNLYTLQAGQQSPRLELKLTGLALEGGVAGGVSVIAGLTNLPVSRINNISPSGSNWSGSIGVG